MATQRTRFSVTAAAGAKRPAPDAAAEEATPQKKVPRASELIFETGPKPQRAAQRLPENAPIIVTLYKVTSRAGDVWNQFEGIQQCDLFQIQLEHEARPGALFGLINGFNDFLKTAGEGMPNNRQALQKEAGIKLVMADARDPEDVGFKAWRAAFYCGGLPENKPLDNFLLLLHSCDHLALNKLSGGVLFRAGVRPYQVYGGPYQAGQKVKSKV